VIDDYLNVPDHLLEHLTKAELRDLAEARSFFDFCEGLDGAQPEFARRGRLVARGAIESLYAVNTERSAARALKEARERAVGILGRQAHEATAPDAFRQRAQAALDAEADFDGTLTEAQT
jgi:hypothetical protein